MDIVVVGGGPWAPDTNFPTHHTARLLSREHRVLYVCRDSHTSLLGHMAGRLPGFHTGQELLARVRAAAIPEQVADNLWVMRLAGLAAALPLSYPPLSRRTSVRLVIHQLRRALRLLGFERPLLWFYWWFFPEIVAAIPHCYAVYDIYDDHNEYDWIRSNPRRQAYNAAMERQLLHAVDQVFAVSRKLVATKTGTGATRYLPNGADISLAEAARSAPLPPELLGIPRPIAGYLGSYDSRTDWTLIEQMAELRPEWSFVFVGGGYTAPRHHPPNLHLLGNRPYPEALRYVNGFDLALIPFVRDALTDAVCPAKLFDYLALGKAVLATPIPAVAEIAGAPGLVYSGSSAQELIAVGEMALREDPQLSLERRALAQSLTWEVRMQRAMDWIAQDLA